MKKQNIIKKNEEFNRIINECRYIVIPGITIYYEKTNLDNYYFGITVSKKLGNAVLRNKIRRQIKNIIDQKEYENGYNCIIMVKKSFVDLDYQSKSNIILTGLSKIGIIKVNNEKK